MMNQNNDEPVTHQALGVVENVTDGIRSAAHSVGQGVRNAAHTVRKAAGRAASAVEEGCEDAGQIARDSFKYGRARARSLEKRFERHVGDHPKTSLLLAAVLGAVILAWWKHERD